MKRYDIDTSCECGRFGDDVNAIEDKDGDWVRFEDIEHLLQESKLPSFDELHRMLYDWKDHKITTLEILEKLKLGNFA